VSLIRWEQDELKVEPELSRLNLKFQDYGYSTDVWLIPSQDSHLELMSKSIDLLRAADNDRNLFILYYAGHGRINSARQAEWTCNQDPNYASVDWSAIQSLFAKARSDVLILLDTCAAASSTMRSQYGTMEAIVASGFESRAPPPGEYSFTNTLIEVLDDWINKRTFSASCLHAEILFQLKSKETRKGKEGVKLEWCTTPIHINYTQDSKFPGIELYRRNILPPPIPLLPPAEPERQSTFVDAMDLDFDDSNTSSSPLSSLTDFGEFQTPHVLIKIGLEQDQAPLDMKQCLRWLESVPMLGKWAKIEGVYPSFSTLIILSLPVSVWDMLPDHPACSFVGYVTSPNLVPSAPTAEKGKCTSVELLGDVLTILEKDIAPKKQPIPLFFGSALSKTQTPMTLRIQSVNNVESVTTKDLTEAQSADCGHGASVNSRGVGNMDTPVVLFFEPESDNSKERWVWMCCQCSSGPNEMNDVSKDPECSHPQKRWMLTEDEDEVHIIKALI
jgi:hypothetical protein